MENATKALIIVANLMLAVIILSVVVYFFENMSILPTEEERVKKTEQARKFNLEYEVYDKKLMYGVDVISALNKANNNNEKYIVGSFLSGDLSGEEFIIDIIVTLKSTTPLQDTITVSYLDDTAFRNLNTISENSSLVERDYSTDNGPEPRIKFSDIRNDYKNFILPDREYSNTIYTSSTNLADENLTTHTIDTTLVGSASGTDYHLLINGRDTKRSDIKKPTKLKELISMTDSMRQYIKNTKVNSPKSYSENGWSSFEWKTALYDLKSRKFKCADIDGNGNEITGIHYNESTGAIDQIRFIEI